MMLLSQIQQLVFLWRNPFPCGKARLGLEDYVIPYAEWISFTMNVMFRLRRGLTPPTFPEPPYVVCCCAPAKV